MANKFTDAMTAMAAELAGEPSWTRYAEYCDARANNLRERSAQAAEQFAEAAQDWPFGERKRFALWLMNSTGLLMDRCGFSRFRSRFSTGGPGRFAPRTVVETVLLPTLIEWRRKEPSNSEPHFWVGIYGSDGRSSLREPVRLDPAHGPSRAALAIRLLRAVDYAQHELPSGYIGDPADDLITLTEAESLVAEAADPVVRSSLEEQISALRATAEDWIRLRGQLTGLDWASRKSFWQARSRDRLVERS